METYNQEQTNDIEMDNINLNPLLENEDNDTEFKKELCSIGCLLMSIMLVIIIGIILFIVTAICDMI